MIDVSVVISTYNRVETLKETLVRVLSRQSFAPERYEVIVVDDHSTDETETFAGTLSAPCRYKYIRNDSNLGRAKTRNRGIRESAGKYLLFLDDDIWVEKNHVEEHFRAHEASGEPVVIVGAVLVAPEIRNTAVNLSCSEHHLWCHREMLRMKNSLPGSFCKTANLSIPQEVIGKVGAFSELFKQYGGEDTEFGWRIVQSGTLILYNENAAGYHFHDETVEGLVKKQMSLALSMKIFCKMHSDALCGDSDGSVSLLSPFYGKGNTVGSVLRNMLKLLMFSTVARRTNYAIVRLLDNSSILSPLVARYLIPVLKAQYKRCGMVASENI